MLCSHPRHVATKRIRTTIAVLGMLQIAVRLASASTVATPTFSPVAGTYTSVQTVAISDSTSGSTIYYTTNGSTPTTSSTQYTGPITVGSSETVKAIGTKSGWTQSAVGSAAYTINLTVATPTFSPAAGTYTSVQTVTISDSTSGSTIYYTTNGSTPTTSSTQYTGPITVSSSETVKAIAGASGYTNSAVGSAAYTINLTTATPTFSPGAGTYTSIQTVTISDSTPGATIYYTTNGSTPTTSSSQYSSPITISSSKTIKAIAAASGYANSTVGSAAYTINLTAAIPAFWPAPGSYGTTQMVGISDATPNATVYYTLDGSTPTTASPKYTSAISVNSTTTVKAIAAASGYASSSVGSATYTITAPATPAPSVSPAAGTYPYGTNGTAVSVTISDSNPAATIYYTTDGSIPTVASSIYSTPVAISSTTTLQAIAVVAGDLTSSITSAVYTVQAPAPAFDHTPGSYVGPQSVTLYSNMGGGTRIYYTTNGTTPTTSSSRYSSPLTVSSTETIEAIETSPGYATSPVSSATYTIASAPATPTLSPSSGSYSGSQLVSISDTSVGATIYYTVTPGTAGTTPTTSSSVYSGTLTVGATSTIEAIAVVSGYSPSTVASATYAVPAQSPTSTSVAVTSSGSPTSSIGIGNMITLTATVIAGGSPVTAGTVHFCDASALYCTDVHLIGSAQLRNSGTAAINVRPGAGNHSYRATYVSTSSFGSSTSGVASLTVTGQTPTITTLAPPPPPIGVNLTVGASNAPSATSQDLIATVWGTGNNASAAPTGTVSILDANNHNSVLLTGSLTPSSSGSALRSLPVVSLPGTVGSTNTLIVSGDFNEDGYSDIAALTGSSVVVSLGNGDGTFTQAPGSPIPSTGYVIASGDLNGDGHLDLVIAGPEIVTVLLGHGDGTFTAINDQQLAVCGGPSALVFRDFNLDGKLDVAMACTSTLFGGSPAVVIFAGNGDGTLTQANGSPVTVASSPNAITAGDFNGDGIPDLALAHEGGLATILLGNGDGTFVQASGSPISVGSELESIATADFNGDGKLDLALADFYYGRIDILLGNGDGTFSVGSSANSGFGGASFSLDVGDFNGDGKADLVLTYDPFIMGSCQSAGSFCQGAVQTFLGDGLGHFSASSIALITAVGPQSVVAGDFNGDGVSDAAVVTYNFNSAAGAVAVFQGNAGNYSRVDVSNIAHTSGGTENVSASYVGDSSNQASVSGISAIVLPWITSIAPSSAGPGTVVKIEGTDFGEPGSGVPVVTFNGISAPVSNWMSSAIKVTVPSGVTSGPVVVTNGVSSNGSQFTVTSAPIIKEIDPVFGLAGSTVTILGNNFGSSGTATFNGVPASVTSWGPQTIITSVPTGATTGPVVVTTGGIPSNSYSFAVGPSISSVTPAQGNRGTVVTITGSGFGAAQGSSTVTLNGSAAVPSSWSDTSIVAAVPAGATTGNITVQVSGISSVGPVFTVFPVITSLSPTSGPIGTAVTITGSNFGVAQGSSSVAFGAVAGSPVFWSEDRISVPVPTGASSGAVALTVMGQGSNSVNFTVGTATSTGTVAGTVFQSDGITPISGATVTLLSGPVKAATATTNSSGAYTLSNVTTATYTLEANGFGYNLGTQSNVSVTSGQTTTVNFSLSAGATIMYSYDALGRLIGVASPTLGAAGYSYDAVGNILSISRIAPGQVGILGFTPQSGPVGTTIAISGTLFSSNPAQNTVNFGNAAATVTSATTTQLEVTVPSGAATGPITVTTPSGTATSTSGFVVTTSSADPFFIWPFDRQIVARSVSEPDVFNDLACGVDAAIVSQWCNKPARAVMLARSSDFWQLSPRSDLERFKFPRREILSTRSESLESSPVGGASSKRILRSTGPITLQSELSPEQSSDSPPGAGLP
jgi:Chitobiase/beta-hexosaminidase C-terminal domain/Carboxypeptidase regulatory-like domain/Fn3 associated/FG-GAP-like repeat/IPT/TIG domain